MKRPLRSSLASVVSVGALALAFGASASPADAAPTAPAARSSNGKSTTGTNKGSKANGSSSSSLSSSTKTTRPPETTARRSVAGGPTFDDTAVGADTPELRALYAAERELFPPAQSASMTAWPDELPFPVASSEDRPRVHSSGLPPTPPATAPALADGGRDLAWLSKLEMPDLPVRWDARVVRYLEFFKDDPRGRSTLTIWMRRSGRYRDAMKKVLRRKGLPEDLVWLSMIESGFDPTARSPVGAMGLWQFMPETGKIYGLNQDRWADQRMSLVAATEAASDFLADLHRRFGSWDLAMAAYNMGYGGVLSAVRKYNTNDFWALSKLEGSLPWETTLYVPKILAAAIVTRNLATFGYRDLQIEAPLEGEDVPVGPGVALAAVATACGVTTKEIEQLNPELRASRTPPAQADWPVKVPAGKGATCTQALAKNRREGPGTERYVVRFGESLEQIAQARHVAVSKLVELNAIGQGEVVRGGTVLLVPKGDGVVAEERKDTASKDKSAFNGKPVVVVPQDMFVYPDRRRVFYRVQTGDSLRELCSTFKTTPDEVRRWNGVDPQARLVEGMTVQLFVPRDADLTGVVVLGEPDVHTVVAGSDEFFQHWDDKGRRRVVVSAKSGDTLESIGKKYGVTTGLMERINRRGRNEALVPGESIVCWVAGSGTPTPNGTTASAIPEATPPLSNPPNPELLPALP